MSKYFFFTFILFILLIPNNITAYQSVNFNYDNQQAGVLSSLLNIFTNTAKAQTPTESISLIRQDCTGYSNCYTSLFAWEEGENRDLVTSNEIAIAQIDGTWTSPDTTAVTIDGWTTSATNYIKIYTTAEARHSGVWDTSKYRLEADAGFGVLNINKDHVRVDGLQIEQTHSTIGNAKAGIYFRFMTGGVLSDIRISNNIIIYTGADATLGHGGISTGNDAVAINLKAWNNIIYDFYLGIRISIADSAVDVFLYNNTIINSLNTGINVTGYPSVENPTFTLKNNLIQGININYYFDFSGNVLTEYITNLSEDTTSPNDALDSKIIVFIDETGDDFHLSSSDIFAKNQGTNLSADVNLSFTDDIDGTTRTSVWDIGADEYEEAPPTQTCSNSVVEGTEQCDAGVSNGICPAVCSSTCTTNICTVDTQTPSIPTNLTATSTSSSQINLSWNESTDNIGVTGYKIYRDTAQITTVTTGTTYSDTGLTAETSYIYTVSAYDVISNTSEQSMSASTVTQVVSELICEATIGTCYYVATNGDNLNDGSFNSPFLTITHGVYNMTAGDILYIRGGTYTPNYPMWVRSDYANYTYGGDSSETMNSESGTQTNPVIFKSYPGENVIIDLVNVDRFINLDNKEYWMWQGLTFINSGIVFYVGDNSSATHNTFKDLTITANRGGDNWGAIRLNSANADYAVISNNKITGPGVSCAICSDTSIPQIHSNTSGIWLNRVNDVKVLNNDISNVPIGIYYKHANAGTENVDIEIAYNYIHETGRNSLNLNNNYAWIHNNLIGGNNASMEVAQANGVPGGDFNIIEHNTFYNSSLILKYQTQAGDFSIPGAINNTVKDNILTTTTYLHRYSDIPHNTTLDYNLYVSGTAIIENRVNYPLSSWKDYYTQDINSIEGTPQFIGGSTINNIADFSLTSSSPGYESASDGTDMGANICAVGVNPTCSATPTPPTADLNSDTFVNSIDWSILNTAWGTDNPTLDLNNDSTINSLDWSVMNAQWSL